MQWNAHLILYALILLAGGLQAAYRWYQKKKILMEAERAEMERKDTILRTGRDPLAEQAAAMQRQAQQQEAELLAQRQEALRRLREQQEAAQGVPQPRPAGGGGGGGGGGPITRELWPGGPVIVINGPAPAPRPAQPQQTRPQSQRSVLQPGRNKKQQRPRQQPAQAVQQEPLDRHDEAYYERERSLARMKASSTPEKAVAAAEPVFIQPSTAQQWRNALIAAEILGTPVSMRDPRGGTGGLGG